MILGYALDDYIMAKTTPFLMAWMMMPSATSKAEDSASEDEVKEGNLARRMNEFVL
jgi:hypothetical protein